jgi:hypothetical protein
MAFLIKNRSSSSVTGPSRQGPSTIDQTIQVSCPARTIPATTTDQIFRVKGGRVLVKGLVGTVTTAIQVQADNMKVTSKALDAASVAIGSAVDVASNVDITTREVGGMYFVEGDGTAGVLSNAGATFVGANSGYWIAPQGEIYLTTSATNTGAMKWDIWYQPLDPTAYVEAVTTATVAI